MDEPIQPNKPMLNAESQEKNTGSEAETAPTEKAKATPSSAEAGEADPLPFLNLEQTNSAGSAGEQKNNANIFFDKVYTEKGLSINIESKSVVEETIEFHEFHDRQYCDRISSHERSYILFYRNRLLEDFDRCRFAVINNRFRQHGEVTMAAVEALVLGITAERKEWFSCTVHKELTLSAIVQQFKKYWTQRTKLAAGTVGKVLVVYANEDCVDNSSGVLHSLSVRGGIADSVSESLARTGLYIVYVCNDLALYRRTIHKNAHFALLHISELHLWLYEKIGGGTSFSEIVSLLETAQGEYGWLRALTPSEQKAQLSDLISQSGLQTTLENLIRNTDTEERQALDQLLKDPLYQTLLFITAFFKGVPVAEFDKLTIALIRAHIRGAEKAEPDGKTKELLIRWETGADEALAKCGVALRPGGGGFGTYYFESNSRANNANNFFSEYYMLFLLRRFLAVEKCFILQNTLMSDAFLQGFAQLCFIAAATDRERYLLQVCANISLEMESADLPAETMTILFARLLFIVRKWEDDSIYGQHIKQFYSHMTGTPFRRGVLGALLGHICTPSRPGNLRFVKILLDGISTDEHLIKTRTIRVVLFNYLEDVPSLLGVIDMWADKPSNSKVPHSFAYAKCSILLLFYECRFGWKNEKGLDHKVLRLLAADASGESLRKLAKFLFSNKADEAFAVVFGDDIRKQRPANYGEAESSSLCVLFGFILVNCYLILSSFHYEDDASSMAPDDFLRFSLELIKGRVSVRILRQAIQRVISSYNLHIRMANTREAKEVYKIKRDTARKLAVLNQDEYLSTT